MQARWIKAVLYVLIADFIDAYCARWHPEDVKSLRSLIRNAKVSTATGRVMEGCDAWVEHGKTPILKFAQKPTCTWIQVIAHELAHIIDWSKNGDGVEHTPEFFRIYRRLLNLWFLSTETVQFVALEKVICDPDHHLDEPYECSARCEGPHKALPASAPTPDLNEDV